MLLILLLDYETLVWLSQTGSRVTSTHSKISTQSHFGSNRDTNTEANVMKCSFHINLKQKHKM